MKARACFCLKSKLLLSSPLLIASVQKKSLLPDLKRMMEKVERGGEGRELILPTDMLQN